MNMDDQSIVDSDLPPMEEVPTLKPEDVQKLDEQHETGDGGSKASSAASSEDFVKVSGRDSEDDPLQSPDTEETTPVVDDVKFEPEDISSNVEEPSKNKGAATNLLNYVDPRVEPIPHLEPAAHCDDDLPTKPEPVSQPPDPTDPISEPEPVCNLDKDLSISPPPTQTEPVLEPESVSNIYEDFPTEPQPISQPLAQTEPVLEREPISNIQPLQQLEQPSAMATEVQKPSHDIMVFDDPDAGLGDEIFPQTIITDQKIEEPDCQKGEITPPVDEASESEPEDAQVPEIVEDISKEKDVLEQTEDSKEITPDSSEVKPSPPPEVEDVPTSSEVKPKMASFQVIDLVHWRDVKQSACVLSFLLLVLGSLTTLSIISVVSYTGLALLSVTIAFRFYKLVLQTLHGTQQPHPFQHLLDYDLTISQEQTRKYADTLLKYANSGLVTARSLLLVQNTVNSLKLGVCLWLLTFIGCVFNGLTLIIIGVIAAFSIPPVYEKYQTQIDQHVSLVSGKIDGVWQKVVAKIPALKPKSE